VKGRAKSPCPDCGAWVAHECPPHVPLRCECSGKILLANGALVCVRCGKSATSLFAPHIVIANVGP